MKKLLLVVLGLALIFAFAACGQEDLSVEDNQNPATDGAQGQTGEESTVTMDTIKVGFIFIGSEADQGYSYAHIEGMKEMQEQLDLSDEQILCKLDVTKDSACKKACRELAEAGCNVIFGNSFDFEDAMLEVAEKYPDVEFCNFSGNQAATSGLENFHNCFGHIYQAQYLGGIVAGMLTESNVLGCVAAKPLAECISGFTAFYLGAKSVNADVNLYVTYTDSWTDTEKESQAAQMLIDKSCDVVSIHTDTVAAMDTCADNNVYGIGYNADMTLTVPEACAASVVWDWTPCYINVVESVVKGESIPADLTGDLADGMVGLTLNDALITPEITEAVEAAKAGILDGSIKVFDTKTFTVEGAFLTEEDPSGLVFNGTYNESYTVSAPSFDYIVDGIMVLE